MFGWRRATLKWQVLMVVMLLAACGAVAALGTGWTPQRGIDRDRDFESWLENKTHLPDHNEILTLGIVPYMAMYYETLEKHDALLGYLSRETGLDVRLNVFNSYGEIIDAIADEKVDLAMLGALGYIKASEKGSAQCLLQLTLDGKPFYEGLIFTKKDSGIKSLRDLKNRSFVFVDPSSTSGYLFPRALLLENGIDPDVDFSDYSFAGSHTEAVISVFMGRADAGCATKMDMSPDILKLFEEGQLVVLAKTARIPSDPIVARRGLDDATKEKIVSAYLKVTAPEDAERFFDDPVERWGRCDDAAFEPVRKLAGSK